MLRPSLVGKAQKVRPGAPSSQGTRGGLFTGTIHSLAGARAGVRATGHRGPTPRPQGVRLGERSKNERWNDKNTYYEFPHFYDIVRLVFFYDPYDITWWGKLCEMDAGLRAKHRASGKHPPSAHRLIHSVVRALHLSANENQSCTRTQ